MTITPIANGISAYRDIASLARPGAAGETATGSPGFQQALSDASSAFVDSLGKGELASTQAVAGEVDIRDVVMAVNNAEIALQTVVAVRDKVIQAYQDILRMPI